MILFLSFAIVKNNKIIEGHSVDEIRIGMSVSQVESILKSKPKKIVWAKHSFEYRFEKEGISIYEKQDDSLHNVFAITVYPNKWKGLTSKGLRVSKRLRIKDVIETYGKPVWGYTTDCLELDAEYEELGIYFSINIINGICDEIEIDHDSLFYYSEVIELTIGKVDTDY